MAPTATLRRGGCDESSSARSEATALEKSMTTVFASLPQPYTKRMRAGKRNRDRKRNFLEA